MNIHYMTNPVRDRWLAYLADPDVKAHFQKMRRIVGAIDRTGVCEMVDVPRGPEGSAGDGEGSGGNQATASEPEPVDIQAPCAASGQDIDSGDRATVEVPVEHPPVVPMEANDNIDIEIDIVTEPVERAAAVEDSEDDEVLNGVQSTSILPLLVDCAMRFSGEDMRFEIREQCDVDGNDVKMLVLTIDRVIVTPARYNDEVDKQPLIEILGEQGARDVVTAVSSDYMLVHQKAIQITVGEIPGAKMLQIMTMAGQVTGRHGRDVWYSTRTD